MRRFSLRMLLGLVAAAAGLTLLLKVAVTHLGVATAIAHTLFTPAVAAFTLHLGNRLQIDRRLPWWRSLMLLAITLLFAGFTGALMGFLADAIWSFMLLAADDPRYPWLFPNGLVTSLVAASAYFAVYRHNVARSDPNWEQQAANGAND